MMKKLSSVKAQRAVGGNGSGSTAGSKNASLAMGYYGRDKSLSGWKYDARLTQQQAANFNGRLSPER